MDMPKPTDAHRKLEKMVGSWTGEEKMHPSPWDPQGGTATARIQNRAALDGFAVVQDYTQERGGQVTFKGHAVMTWDAPRTCYAMYWWDSMGTPMNEFLGNFEGPTLILENKNPQGYSRAIMEFPDPKSYAFRMEVSPDRQKWVPFMEGKYRKEG